jgi:hypothetical protein
MAIDTPEQTDEIEWVADTGQDKTMYGERDWREAFMWEGAHRAAEENMRKAYAALAEILPAPNWKLVDAIDTAVSDALFAAVHLAEGMRKMKVTPVGDSREELEAMLVSIVHEARRRTRFEEFGKAILDLPTLAKTQKERHRLMDICSGYKPD